MAAARGGFGFPRAHRILTGREYDAVFKSGQACRARCIRALFRFRDAEGARLGLIVSRKAMAHAVDRNRAKRVIRDCFRHVQASLPALDIVIQVRAEARDTALLRADLEQIWQRLARVRRAATEQGSPSA